MYLFDVYLFTISDSSSFGLVLWHLPYELDELPQISKDISVMAALPFNR